MTKKNLNLTFEQLLNKIEIYDKEKEEIELIKKAYEYAAEKHFGTKRLTGEDYILHPLNVAYILVETYKVDCATICAALLHDVLEDCDVTKEEMEQEFGKEITELVDGVTKINRLNFQGDNEATIANHRKILVGLSEDVRVIIIKLADRLHNMRTLWVLPEKKQKQTAKETLDILTPIASRLGMNQMKSELEDLSLRYYKPEAYFSIVEKLNQTKKERDNNVVEMMESVSTLLNEHSIKHEIKGRAKSIHSIYKKLDKGRRFSDIYDLLAMRVFVETEAECYQALGIIHSKYRPIPKRFKDYIAMPKTNMYQSLHTTVFGIDGHLYEIQIRTHEMDRIAEYGIASHWSYKEKGSVKASMQNAMEQKLQFFRAIIELKNEEESDEGFVQSVQDDILHNIIYVFTPKGDVVELPKDSTPIDFAYKVHSKVGDKMVGAIVNNNIVPLDYKLQNNDIIKINTNQNSFGPSREWINIVKTTSARNKIKGFFNKIDKEGYLKKGEELLNKEIRKRKLSITEILNQENLEKILKELKFIIEDELYINLGSEKITPTQVLNIITNNNKSKQELILDRAQNQNIKPQISPKTDIIVRGIDNVKINIASCCHPVPEDRIVGYITKGYGITVHRMVCPNVNKLEERIIDVEWNERTAKKYPTTILVEAIENKDILMEIISKTSNTDIIIQSINTMHTNENYMYEITVSVENKSKLVKFMGDINSIPSIINVERIIH